MKVALVSTYSSPEATGLRLISSLLKSSGHRTQMIFLTLKRGQSSQTSYPPEVIEQFIDLVKDAGLIAISLMTNTYYQACELTKALTAAGIKAPVVWGGVHPTAVPQSCIDFADILCVGEGEWPMVDLANALQEDRDYSHIDNLWIRRNGQIIRNDVRPLFEQLDQLPFPDYQLDQQHHILHKGKLVPARPKNMRGTLVRYRLLTTRGCPYACTFCCNSKWLEVYRNKGKWVRKRSIPNVIAELEQIKKQFDTVRAVNILDDTFFVRTEEEFEQFAQLYRQRIAWPFEINTHPATITAAKIQLLHDCGCAMVKMGIQSGSQNTNYDIYNRRISNQAIAQAIEILGRFPNLQKEYHYIVNNPLEPEQNMIETLRFVAQHHPGNCKVVIFPLALFPGSQLHRRAKQEGILKDKQDEIYQRVYTGKAKRRFDRLGYLTMLLYAVVRLKKRLSARQARKFVNFMTARHVRYILDRAWFKYLVLVFYLFGRLLRGVFYQVFLRRFRKHRHRYLLPTET